VFRAPRTAVADMPTPVRPALLLVLAFAAFYAATTRGVFVFGDDLLMYQVTEAVVERGAIDVSSPSDRGVVARSIPGREGRRYSKYGLGLSLAAVPFDFAGRVAERAGVDLPATTDSEGSPRTGTRVFAVGLTNALAGALAVLALFTLALEAGFTTRVATGLAALLGLGTLFAHYAATFLSEPLAAAALTGSAAAALRWRRLFDDGEGEARRAARAAAASGLLAGAAILVKTAHLIAAAPIGLWIGWVAWRSVGRSQSARLGAPRLWSLSVLPGVGASAAYNWARFGSVLATGYGEEATRFTTSPWVDAPPLLLALAGARALLRRRPDAFWLVVGVATGPILLASAYYQWHGGGSWGPRLLLPILPLLLLPAGEVVARAAEGGVRARVGLAGCALAGLAVVALGLLVPFDLYNREIWPTPREPRPELLADAIWRPSASPLLVHARQLPRAAESTSRLLLGLERLPGALEKERPGLPDLAFARYGSHALLQWTRAGLLVALAFGVGLAATRSGRSSILADRDRQQE